MLYPMAQKADTTILGQIFLTIGISGYITNNIYLAYICLAFALACFARQLLVNLIDKVRRVEKIKEIENNTYPPVQTVSPHNIITN